MMQKVTTDTWILAQQSVLGACLIEERCSGKIVFGLQETDFIEQYRTLYRTIKELYTTGKPVDPVSVLALAGAEYRQTVKELMEITPTAANIDSYIEVTRQQAKILHMRDLGRQLAEVDDAEDGRQLAEQVMALEVVRDSTMWTMHEALKDFWKRYQQPPNFMQWFIPQFRNILKAKAGSLIYLGARPSVGKSAFAYQTGMYWAAVCGLRVGLFSHECSREDVTDRMVACGAGVSYDALQNHALDEKDVAAAAMMSARIDQAPIEIHSAAGKSVQQIQALTIQRRYDVVIVDYVQIVAGSGRSEYEVVSGISKSLQQMCRKFNVTCLALCQLDRVRGAEPTLEDLRSSGQLEQDADLVILLHKQDDGRRKMMVAKNRNGICRPTRLDFDGSVQQFRYLGKGDKPIAAYDYTKLPNIERLPDDTEVPFEKFSDSEEKI